MTVHVLGYWPVVPVGYQHVRDFDISAMKLFSNRRRPVHLGPYPLERLKRVPLPPRDDGAERPPRPLPHTASGDGRIAASIDLYLRLFEQFRDGAVSEQKAPIELDPSAIAADLKAGGYFLDATMMACCEVPDSAWYATGDEGTPFAPYHRYAIIVLVEDGRPVDPGNAAAAWVEDSDGGRNAVRALEIANVLAGYIRNLGWSARAHSRDAGDICHDRLVIRAGLGELLDGHRHPLRHRDRHHRATGRAGPAAGAAARHRSRSRLLARHGRRLSGNRTPPRTPAAVPYEPLSDGADRADGGDDHADPRRRGAADIETGRLFRARPARRPR
jgi:hypothetical protein